MTTQPCPYHVEKQPCEHRKRCPLLHSADYVVCTALSLHDIAMVRAWVVGKALDREEI
jgi:hypothetical protein